MLYTIKGSPRRHIALLLAWMWVVAAAMAGEPCLVGRTSSPQSVFKIGEHAEVLIEASGLKPGEKRDLSIVLKDERGRQVGICKNDGISADGRGCWSGAFTVPTDRLGFRRVCVSSGSLTLPKCGSRPKGCLTFAVVPDPVKRPKISETDAFFGLQGRGFCHWTGAHHLFSASTPSTNNEANIRRTCSLQSQDVPVYGTIAAEYRFIKPFMTKEAARYFAGRAKTAKRLPFSFAEGDAEGERMFRETTRAFAAAARASRPGRRIYEYAQECDIHSPDAETTIRCQKAFYEEVHAADPEAVVVAAGVSNVSRPKQSYMQRLFELGIADSMDAFSIHPYTPYPPERNDFISNIRAFTGLVRKYKGVNTQMFATEGGFAAAAADEVLQMEGNIRVALILLGEGYSMHLMFWTRDFGNDDYTWFDGDYGLNYNLELKKNRYSNSTSPRPVLPALAAATLMVDGMRPVTSIENLGPTSFGYAYADSRDRCTIALWDYGNEPRETVLPVGRESIDVADIMGNVTRRKAPGGKLSLTLTGAPVYVLNPDPSLWGTKGTMRRKMIEEREERRRREEAACRAKIVSVSPTFSGGRSGVRVEVENMTPSNLVCRILLRIRGIPEARKSAELSLSPRAKGISEIIFAPGVKIDPSETKNVEVSVACADGYRASGTYGMNFLCAHRVSEAVGRNGCFTEWTAPDWFEWPMEAGTEAEGVRMALGWNSRYLFADIEVQDNLFNNMRTGFMTWSGDSVQIGLAKAALSQSSGNYLSDLQEEAMSEITFAMTTNGPSAYRTVTFDPERFPSDMKGGGEISRSDLPIEIDVHTNVERVVVRYRAAIPWRFMNIDKPFEGLVVRMGAYSNDRDASRASTALKCRKWFALKDPKNFAYVVLSGKNLDDRPTARLMREIGQSQPLGEKPVRWTACEWCVDDADRNVYLPDGWRIRRGMRHPEKCIDEVPGRKFSNGRGRIWSWDIRTGRLVEVRITKQGLQYGTEVLRTKPWQDCRFFAAPSKGGGWTKSAAFGMLNRREGVIEGFRSDGTPMGILLDCRAAGISNALDAAFHPLNGDLLVSDGWPRRQVRRFDVRGIEVASGVWPHQMQFPATATGIGLIGEDVYFCGYVVERMSESALPLSKFRFDCTHAEVTSMADGGDGWWFATSNGALYFRKSDPSRCDTRIGGVAKPAKLWIADGRVKARIGGRVYSFWIDDLSCEAPVSTGFPERRPPDPDPSAEDGGWNISYDSARAAILITKESDME